jgi:xylulokinase
LAPLHWYEGPQGSTVPHKGQGFAVQSFFLPHAVRFLKERPEDYAKTKQLFSVQEWLSWRLGAEAVTTLPAADYEPFYWNSEQLSLLGLDGTMLPPFAELGSVIGRLSPAAAHRLSSLGGFEEAAFPAGIPILAGGPDFIMALIGVGAVKPGIVCDRAGTSEGINYCSASRPESAALRVLPHVIKGYWNVSAVMPVSGSYFERYRTLTGQEDRDYGDLLSIMDTDGMGRAVLEAVGFMVKGGLETLNSQGFPVDEMRLSGGQGKNKLWNQLKADITGTVLLALEIPDGELGGGAVLGALALGEAAGIAEGAERIVHIRERFAPDPKAAADYEERFRRRRS